MTRILLSHYAISCPLFALDQHKEFHLWPKLYDTLSQGHDVALLTDAGTPGLSDPGAIAVSELRKKGVRIVPIPGPSAISSLLSVSGFSGSQYYFAGFLPRKSGEILQELRRIQHLNCPIVWFESPKRLMSSLNTIQKEWPDCSCVLGKELTKTFETLISGPIETVLADLETIPIKGEWSICIFPPPCESELSGPSPAVLTGLLELGLSPTQLKKMAGLLGWPKNKVYASALEIGS